MTGLVGQSKALQVQNQKTGLRPEEAEEEENGGLNEAFVKTS